MVESLTPEQIAEIREQFALFDKGTNILIIFTKKLKMVMVLSQLKRLQSFSNCPQNWEIGLKYILRLHFFNLNLSQF